MAKWRWAARGRVAALVVAVAAIVALVAAAAGCRDGVASPPWRVVVAYPSTLSSLHPALSSDEFSYSIISNVFEPLVDMDGRQKLRAGLAVAWHNVAIGGAARRLLFKALTLRETGSAAGAIA